MRVLKRFAFFFVFIALSFAAHAADFAPMQEPKVEYSADSYVETGNITVKMKVYHAPGKDRHEMGQGIAMIMRRDKDLIWNLMTGEKMYQEYSMKDAPEDKSDMSDYKVKHTVIGPDTVEGVKTTKSKVVMVDEKGRKYEGFMWTTKEGILMKTDTEGDFDGKKMRVKSGLKNLKIGRVDHKLFEIPAGYKKMASPFEMMEEYNKAAEKEERERKAEEKRRLEEERRERKAREGRSYTGTQRSYTAGERSYTAAPRKDGVKKKEEPESASDTAKDTAKKLWKLFGK